MGCPLNRDKQQTKVFHYLVLGLESAGKTSVIKAYESKSFDESVDATTLTSITEFQKHEYLIRTVEFGGSKENRKKWHEIYDIFDYDAIIFVMDGSKPSSFDEAKEELSRIMLQNVEEIENIPVAVFVNKSDLGTQINHKELNQIVKDAAKGKRNFANVYVVSSKTGENIMKGFGDLNSHLDPQFCCCDSRYRKKKKTDSSDQGSTNAVNKTPIETNRN